MNKANRPSWKKCSADGCGLWTRRLGLCAAHLRERGLALCGPAPISFWTDEKIAQLHELFDAGLSLAEIGQRMGVTKNTIVGRCCRQGMTRRKERPVSTTEMRLDALNVFMDSVLSYSAHIKATGLYSTPARGK